ncbi:hypothetical protein [Kineosporia sp. NBRC 101731]|uniref:hypothetical protein n=1 Tax=Kineosporia sp. NBRC 101731 TaxID=3032199 RepID=UPI002554FC3D|nr:hypothetical protein [Kineosporia sp. NBRC 101731]
MEEVPAGGLLAEDVLEVGSDLGNEGLGEALGAPEGGDGVFDEVGGEVGEVASLAAADALEVVVGGAGWVGGLGVDQAGLGAAGMASGAAEAALEKVVEGAAAFTCGAVGSEGGLDLGEELGADQGFMAAGVLGAVRSDDPEVVRVAEHLVDLGVGDRSGGVAAGAGA